MVKFIPYLISGYEANIVCFFFFFSVSPQYLQQLLLRGKTLCMLFSQPQHYFLKHSETFLMAAGTAHLYMAALRCVLATLQHLYFIVWLCCS